MGHQRREILVFAVGGRRYGLLAADVLELVRAVAIDPLPGAPPGVEGVVNFRGKVIPVYDLRARLGLPAKGLDLSDHLIVFGAREAPAALRIDEAIELTGAEVEAGAGGTAAALAARVAKLADGLVPVLDLPALLAPGDGGPGPTAGPGGPP